MISTLALAILTAVFQVTAFDLTIVTLQEGSSADIPLSPSGGEVRARREDNRTRIEVRIGVTDMLTAFGDTHRAYVVWAVTPEGEFESLGELGVDGRRAELDTHTSHHRFGLLVTAEPYLSVDEPSSAIAFGSAPPRNNEAQAETTRIEVGQYDYSDIGLPPQGSVPPHVIQARMAFRIAQAEGVDEVADEEFREARVAYDSMEELLRRSMDPAVLSSYVSDSIRFSARAIRVGRERRIENQLADSERRVANLEGENGRLSREIERLDGRLEQARVSIDQLQADLQAIRTANRQLELDRDERARELREAEAEIDSLRDSWPPLVDALTAAGARQIPRGVQITLPGSRFDGDNADFAEGTREILARLVGILAFGDMPEIRIEGHTRDSGPVSGALTISEERANAVGDYLLESGIYEERIHAEGFGISRPVPGVEDPADPVHDRVEIIILEP